jgi:hypothetical protein
MSNYEVSANGIVFGVYEADSEQAARDACAQDAGYDSEADMIERNDSPSELVATLTSSKHEWSAKGWAASRV